MTTAAQNLTSVADNPGDIDYTCGEYRITCHNRKADSVNLLTTADAAALLGLSTGSIRRFRSEGRLTPAAEPSQRCPLYRRADVEKLRDRPKAGNPNFVRKRKTAR